MKHHTDESIALKKVTVKTNKEMTNAEIKKAEKDAAILESNKVRSRFGLSPLKK